RFEALPQLPNRLPDDQCEVTVRDFRAHQRRQRFEVVAQLRPRRELDPVPRRRERLEDGAPRGGGGGERRGGGGGETTEGGTDRRRCRRRYWHTPLRKFPNDGRGIRSRSQLRHHLLDLALGLVDSPSDERVPVLSGENRRQPGDAAQVEPAVGEQLE